MNEIFEVYVDDTQIYADSAMSDSGEPEAIDESLKGANLLRLVAKDAGDGGGVIWPTGRKRDS